MNDFKKENNNCIYSSVIIVKRILMKIIDKL